MVFTPEIYLVGLVLALSASLLGNFVILRRVSLTADALSHIALPGLALGIVLHFNPFLGAAGILLLAAGLIVLIEKRSGLGAETIIAILFTAGLAIGFMIIPEESILEAFFGDLTRVSLTDAWLVSLIGLLIILAIVWQFKNLSRVTFSSDLAKSEGVDVTRTNFIFLVLLAATVAIGIRYIGTLLMGALIILPAATACNLSRSLRQMILLSLFFGLLSMAIGFLVSLQFNILPGPAVILSGTAIFLVTLLFKKRV